MSLNEFWISVRTGARFVAPRATVDSPKLDANAIEQALRRATLWLTPNVAAGFDEADFSFLADAEKKKLASLVKEFRQTAAEVSPIAPANDDQIVKALPLFRDIVAMMEFDRYGDAEAYRLGKQIERAIERHRPRELVELRFNTGTDNTGEPGIWIWGFLSDEEDDAFLRRAKEVRPLLAWASRVVAPDLYPYISFRSVSEQAEMAEVEAE